MKLFKVSLCFALLVVVCLPAVAQTQMKLDIPFNFSAAGKSLPAGHYRVVQVFDANKAAWRISTDHHSVMALTNSVESAHMAHRPSLVFLRTGDSYSLVQIWPEEFAGRDMVLRPEVQTTILAEGGNYGKSKEYVEIAAK